MAILVDMPYSITRKEIVQQYCEYVEKELQKGVPLSRLVHPVFALFKGQPGANAWRRYLSEHTYKGVRVEVLEEAVSLLNGT